MEGAVVIKLDYDPHNGVAPRNLGQRALHELRGDHKGLVAQVGRRWGKSRFGFGDLMDVYDRVLSMKRPPSLIPPFHAWVVVPTFPQGRQTWHELMSLTPPELLAQKPQASKWMLYLAGNSNWQGRAGVVEVRSSFDPEALQTVGLDYLWTSESQDIDNEAYEKVLPTTRSPGRMGWVYHEGIPPTYPEHWFYRVFEAAKRGALPGFASFHATYKDNPMLTEEQLREIEGDREVLSAVSWERLYLALYSANAGFFRNIDQAIVGDILPGPVPGATYVGGLDIGRAEDPTVLIMLDSNDRRVVNYWEWDRGVSWVSIREQLVAIHNEWALERLVFDATALGGKMVEEDLAGTSLPIEPFAIVAQYRQELLERLSGALERGTLSFPPIAPLIRQLRGMQHRRLANGTYRVEVPKGEHDDYVFALALGLQACSEPRAVMRPVFTRSTRYVQTQAEAEGRGRSSKALDYMRERRSARMQQRAKIAGVQL
jgi:hypothetical protein